MNWNFNSPSEFQVPDEDHQDDAHQGAIYSFQVVGNCLVTASADQTLRKWDLAARRLIQPPLVGHEASVLCLKVDENPEENVIISGSADSSFIVWKFSTGDLVKRIRAHDESVLSLDFGHKYLVTGSKDKKVKLWNRRSIRDMSALPEFVRSDFIAAAGLEDYSLVATLEGHCAAVNAVQIQGDIIISGSGDASVKVWDIHTGQSTHSISSHNRGIADLLFNGRFSLTGSTDNSASMYDVQDQVEKARLTGHTSLVRAVHAIFDGQGQPTQILTGSYDGTVRVWEKDPADAETWFAVAILEYGNQPEPISDANPNIHIYPEGRRVFEVGSQDNRVFCSGQGNTITGWEFSSSKVDTSGHRLSTGREVVSVLRQKL